MSACAPRAIGRTGLISLLLASLLLTPGCTENPFMEVEKIAMQRVTGAVQLSDHSQPDQVLAWLEVLNLNGQTGSDGRFAVYLPPPEIQGYGLGFSGDLDLYFFLANYRLQQIPVRLVNGELAKSQLYVDDAGRLRNPVRLEKVLSIHTTLSADTIPACFADSLHAWIEISTDEPAVRYTLKRRSYTHVIRPALYCGLIFEPLGSSDDTLRFYEYEDSFFFHDTVRRLSPKTHRMDLVLTQLGHHRVGTSGRPGLPVGRYRVYPFIDIHQPGVPLSEPDIPWGIVASTGRHEYPFGHDYHLLPMKRRDAVLVVRVSTAADSIAAGESQPD